jgi:hypothetical protein
MRRLQSIVLALVVLGAATPAFAQTAGKSFGITAGFGAGYGTVPNGHSRKMEPTVNGGVMALLPLSANWAFQPELKWDHRKLTTGGISTNMNYVSIPLLFRNKFRGVYMVQGIAINPVMSASILDVDFKDAIRTPDVSIIIGVGKRFDRWSLEGRWETGLRTVQKDLQFAGVHHRSLTAVGTVYLK